MKTLIWLHGYAGCFELFFVYMSEGMFSYTAARIMGNVLHINQIIIKEILLTLVLLNPDMSCLCNMKKPTDLDLHYLPLNIWTYSNNPNQVLWLVEN